VADPQSRSEAEPPDQQTSAGPQPWIALPVATREDQGAQWRAGSSTARVDFGGCGWGWIVIVEVRSRVPDGGAGVPPVLVELSQERITLRELIRLAVTEQVAELRVNVSRCRQLLDRQYMTDGDVAAAAKRGALKMPSRAHMVGELDVDAEVERALHAFEGRRFVVFNGGRQVEHLDDEVSVRLGEPVVFLRLTALVGG
jgi:hypothetical protein